FIISGIVTTMQSAANCFFCSSVMPDVIFCIDALRLSLLDTSSLGDPPHPLETKETRRTDVRMERRIDDAPEEAYPGISQMSVDLAVGDPARASGTRIGLGLNARVQE